MPAKKPNRIRKVGEEKEGACESDLMESSPQDHKRKSTPRLRCVNSADPSPGHLSQSHPGTLPRKQPLPQFSGSNWRPVPLAMTFIPLQIDTVSNRPLRRTLATPDLEHLCAPVCEDSFWQLSVAD